jgi:hypothetical protein
MWSRWNYNNIGRGSHLVVDVAVVGIGIGIGIGIEGAGISGGSECGGRIRNIIQSSVNDVARRRVK